MIDRIHIQNFKCLRDVEVELGAFNVLIGPNDSGKTSFLEAIRWLACSDSLQSRAVFFWKKQTENPIVFDMSGCWGEKMDCHLEVTLGDSAFNQKLTAGGNEVFEVTENKIIHIGGARRNSSQAAAARRTNSARPKLSSSSASIRTS